MLASYVVLHLVTLGNAAAFFAVRHVVARWCGVRGAFSSWALDRPAWTGVRLSRRLAFVLLGPLACYLCSVLLSTVGAVAEGKMVPDEGLSITAVPDSPAEAAGFHDHDRVVSANGERVHDWDQLKAAVSAHPGDPIHVEIERAGKKLELTPTPGESGKIGILPTLHREGVGVGAALGEALVLPVRMWAWVAKNVATSLSGGATTTLSGPLGIVNTTARASEPTSLRLLGALNAYYLWIPVLAALILFPRTRRHPS